MAKKISKKSLRKYPKFSQRSTRNPRLKFKQEFSQNGNSKPHEQSPEPIAVPGIPVDDFKAPLRSDQGNNVVEPVWEPEPVIEPVIDPQPVVADLELEPVAKELPNTLMDSLLEETDKDSRIEKDLEYLQDNEDYDNEEDESDDSGDDEIKVKIDPLQLRKEARFKALAYTNAIAVSFDNLGKIITGNPDETRFKISEEDRKLIRDPWAQYLELRAKSGKKKRSPGYALAAAITSVTLPMAGMLIVESVKAVKRNKKDQKQDALNIRKEEMQEILAMIKLHQDGNPIHNIPADNLPDRVRNPATVRNKKASGKYVGRKNGRHKASCPKHLDPKNGECNCK